MASVLSIVNRLLPFATPGTPLIQDLLHLGVICAALYFAPQIQERLQQQQRHGDHNGQEAQVQGQASETQHNANRDLRHTETTEELGGQDQQVFEQGANQPDEAANNNDDFQEFQRQQNIDAEGAVAGPANATNVPAQRNVGAKKAKSLARKDQRRAYHEFQRVQGEAQRAKDAEGAAEREAALAAERERRKAAEAKLDAKKARERELKREQERRERESEIARRELAVELVRRELDEQRMSNLFDVARQVGGDADEVWVEKIVDASGLLGKSIDGMLTMVTSTGWVVRVSRQDMMRLYTKAAEESVEDENGKIGFDEVGRQLESILREPR